MFHLVILCSRIELVDTKMGDLSRTESLLLERRLIFANSGDRSRDLASYSNTLSTAVGTSNRIMLLLSTYNKGHVAGLRNTLGDWCIVLKMSLTSWKLPWRRKKKKRSLEIGLEIGLNS